MKHLVSYYMVKDIIININFAVEVFLVAICTMNYD